MKNIIEIDAKGKKIGRVASQAAVLLMGKNLVNQVRNSIPDVSVKIANASKLQIDAKKKTEKDYASFSGYPGGITSTTLKEKLEKKPEDVVRIAVRGMLAPNRLRRLIMRRLKVVASDKHNFPIDKTL